MNRPESKQMSIYSSWQYRFSESNQITGRHLAVITQSVLPPRFANSNKSEHLALLGISIIELWRLQRIPTIWSHCCCSLLHSLLWLKSNMTSRWCTLLIKPSHLQKYTSWWFKERGYKLAFAQSLLNTQWKIKLYSSFEHVHVCKEADAVGRHKHRLYVSREMMMMMVALNRVACLGNSMATDFCTKLGNLLQLQMLLFSYQN